MLVRLSICDTPRRWGIHVHFASDQSVVDAMLVCVCMDECMYGCIHVYLYRRMCASLINGNNPIANRMRNRAIDTRVRVYACTDACAHRWTRRSNVQSTIEYAIDTRVCAHVQSSAASIDNCMKQDSLPCAFACVQSQSTLACGHEASVEQHNIPIRLAC